MIMMRMTLIRCRLEKYDKDDDDLLTRASQCFRSDWCLVMIMMRMSRMMRMRCGQDDNDENYDDLPTRGSQSFGYAWCITSLQ